jgi:ureidoglycolate dehydrogenase (NAD+)
MGIDLQGDEMGSGQSDSTNGSARLIPAAELHGFVKSVLIKLDVPQDDAAIVADCLLAANLSGIDSHGVLRFAHYTRRLQNGTIKAQPTLKFDKKGPSVGMMDGDDGLGHVVSYHACTHAMELAEESGNGIVVVKNSSHFGIAGFYVQRIVAEGYMGMVMTTTDAFLIPHGAKQPFFGTNPIAIGFPSDGLPVILDMATTMVAHGKTALAKKEGKAIPPDWGLDEDGKPTTDPNRIVGFHPMAGPKGSGLAMMIDIFCSILSGMPWGPHITAMYGELDKPRKLGHWIMALDIKRFMNLEVFKERLGEMLRALGELTPAEGFTRVYAPGQIEAECRQRRSVEGIPLDPGVWRELEALGREFNLPFGS